MKEQNLFVVTFGLSVSVIGGVVLAQTVENKALSLVSPPTAQRVISTKRRKLLGCSTQGKQEKHHDLIMENLHAVNWDVYQ